MARCPFATWHPISGSSGRHLAGPYRIVHHTTEGSTAESALETFQKKRSDPHFTVDGHTIYQHIDTAESARAMVNAKGGVETNRLSVVQIEVVGFAHLPKSPEVLRNVARLCRWIEDIHGISRDWPAGPPKRAVNGKDPGGHNRDAAIWVARGGHYGHCHVPENIHWDPAYTSDEVAYLKSAEFDESGSQTSGPTLKATATRAKRVARAAAPAHSTMPDHGDVPTGPQAYVNELALLASPGPMAGTALRKSVSGPAKRALKRAVAPPAAAEGMVNVGSVISFVAGITDDEKDDVLDSVQIAQRGASGVYDRLTQTVFWYRKYVEILENLGWTSEQLAFAQYEQTKGRLEMDKAALGVIAAIATQGQLAVINASITALSKLSSKDDPIRIFDYHASADGSGNFQIGAIQRAPNGTLSMALGAFYFRGLVNTKSFLFFKWGKDDVNLWSSAQRMTLNRNLYATVRSEVRARLAADASRYLSGLKIAVPA